MLRATAFRLAAEEHVRASSDPPRGLRRLGGGDLPSRARAALRGFRAGATSSCRRFRCSTAISRTGSASSLSGAKLERESGFWRDYLAGAPTFIPLAAVERARTRRSLRGRTAQDRAVPEPRGDLRAAVRQTRALRRTCSSCRFRDAPLSGDGSGRPALRGAVGEPRPCRVRGRDRVLREHDRHASPAGRQPDLSRASRPSTGNGAPGTRASGAPVRSRGRADPAAARSRRQPAVPGELPHSGWRAADARARRCARDSAPHRCRPRAFRPGFRGAGSRGWHRRRIPLRNGTVRASARSSSSATAFEALLEDALADPSRRMLVFELPAEPATARSRAGSAASGAPGTAVRASRPESS